MQPNNLTEKYKDLESNPEFLEWRKKNSFFRSVSFSDPEPKTFGVGDEITFIGGHDRDILFRSKITAISKQGDLYVLWDCYWFAIDPKEKERQVKKL